LSEGRSSRESEYSARVRRRWRRRGVGVEGGGREGGGC